MTQRIVVIGGGAAGIGAAGAAKGTDPAADVVVYTEFEDVGGTARAVFHMSTAKRSPISSGFSWRQRKLTRTRALISTMRHA